MNFSCSRISTSLVSSRVIEGSYSTRHHPVSRAMMRPRCWTRASAALWLACAYVLSKESRSEGLGLATTTTATFRQPTRVHHPRVGGGGAHMCLPRGLGRRARHRLALPDIRGGAGKSSRCGAPASTLGPSSEEIDDDDADDEDVKLWCVGG